MMKRLSITLIALCCTAISFAQSAKTSNMSTESSTVSINSSDHDYSLVAVYSTTKAAKIKNLLTDALGKAATDNEDLSLWNLKSTYTVTFKAGKLIIDLDKDKATGALLKSFEKLGTQIQQALGAPAN